MDLGCPVELSYCSIKVSSERALDGFSVGLGGLRCDCLKEAIVNQEAGRSTLSGAQVFCTSGFRGKGLGIKEAAVGLGKQFRGSGSGIKDEQ